MTLKSSLIYSTAGRAAPGEGNALRHAAPGDAVNAFLPGSAPGCSRPLPGAQPAPAAPLPRSSPGAAVSPHRNKGESPSWEAPAEVGSVRSLGKGRREQRPPVIGVAGLRWWKGSNRLPGLCRWRTESGLCALDLPEDGAPPLAPLKSGPKARAGLRQRALESARQNDVTKPMHVNSC